MSAVYQVRYAIGKTRGLKKCNISGDNPKSEAAKLIAGLKKCHAADVQIVEISEAGKTLASAVKSTATQKKCQVAYTLAGKAGKIKSMLSLGSKIAGEAKAAIAGSLKAHESHLEVKEIRDMAGKVLWPLGLGKVEVEEESEEKPVVIPIVNLNSQSSPEIANEDEPETESNEDSSLDNPADSLDFLPPNLRDLLTAGGINTVAGYQEFTASRELTELDGIGNQKAKIINNLIEQELKRRAKK